LSTATQKGTGEVATADTSAGKGIVRLEYVDFEQGTATLTKDARSQLVDLSEALRKYPQMRIEIGVHTDARGDAGANLELSQKRADGLKIFLGELGVDASRVKAVGYGSSKPLEEGTSPEANRRNKRTEFRILSQ
jgi:outer membrane protein OmpA-like peptidoglycan-associated protein